jgi:hypothetical protein
MHQVRLLLEQLIYTYRGQLEVPSPNVPSVTLATVQNQTFQNGNMEVSFYRMATAENNGHGFPFTSLSTVKMRFNSGTGEQIKPNALKCHVTGMDAYVLDNAAMTPLAHIFAGGIRHTKEPHLYDWTQMLGNKTIPGLGATVHALNQLALIMNAPFTFDNKASVPDANRFFHTWFQSLHAVRMAVVEGGHRCETAMRLFYGFEVGQPAPLQRKSTFTAIGSNSTMVLPVAIKILNNLPPHTKITDSVVANLQEYSDVIQQQRDQTVRSTHKQLWQVIYDDCFEVLMSEKYSIFQAMSLSDFVSLRFESKKCDDTFCTFIDELNQVITNRYYRQEPGRTEIRNLPREQFQIQLDKPKLQGRGFKGLSQVSVYSDAYINPSVQPSHIPSFSRKSHYKKAPVFSRNECSNLRPRTMVPARQQAF